MASAPVPASRIVQPSPLSRSRNDHRSSDSSSTMRIVAGDTACKYRDRTRESTGGDGVYADLESAAASVAVSSYRRGCAFSRPNFSMRYRT